MSSTPEEINASVEKAMKLLHDAKIHMWISDFEEAAKATNACYTALLEIRADFYHVHDQLNEFQKSLGSEGYETSAKLKVGEKIREEGINTDLILAMQLYRTVNKFKQFLEEVFEAEDTEELKPTLHNSGFKFRLVDLETERYELKALGEFSLSSSIIQSLISKITNHLQEQNLTPNDIRIVDKYPADNDKLFLSTLRIFVTNNAVMNMTLFRDGTLVADIQTPQHNMALKLVDISLNALAGSSPSPNVGHQ